MSRLHELFVHSTQGYLDNSATPDHVKSEPVPAVNTGPLYDVVSDTLMPTVHKHKVRHVPYL